MTRIGITLCSCVCALALASAAPASSNTFSITPNTSSGNPLTYKWSVSIDGAQATNNPPLTVMTGQTYDFSVSNVAFHPFWIDETTGLGGTNSYPTGDALSDNGVTTNKTIKMNLPADAPDTLYYACGFHSSMTGTITVVHDLVFRNKFE
jgi:hypothetical protein